MDWRAPFDALAAAAVDARARAGDPAARSLDHTALALVALRAERDYAARLAAGVTLRAGARAAVESFALTLRVGLVTGWRRADAERVLALAGLDATVRFVAAADDAPDDALARRTDAARVAAALGRLRGRADPHTVAALLDSPAALRVAREAGVRTAWARSMPMNDAQTIDWTAALDGLTSARLAALLDPAPPTSPLPDAPPAPPR